uniref:FOLD3 n=1 Tax=Colaphellus bowringi TaxID=561076 RepID=A0A8G0VK83_9CUCU|nr:FOLD3 [Colaphellus bowringi]
MDRWVDKVAIVTGASAGIGLAICQKLVQAGVRVVGLARRAELIDAAAQELSGEKGKLYAVKCDMSKEQDIIDAFAWTMANVGHVSILINNAGVAQQTTLIDGETEKWKDTLDVNVLGLCIATREAVKSMRDSCIDGHIVHINSILGHKVFFLPTANVYPATKHAVTALTESLRFELNSLKSKIKVTSVSPGLVATDLIARLPAGLPTLQATDVADAVLYVLSTPPHVQIQELTIKPLNEEF